MKTKIEVENVENNLFISDLLTAVSDILKERGEEVDVKKTTIPGTKGGIIIAILVGVASNLLTDVIKLALKNLTDHINYDSKCKIKIDKTPIEIGDLLLNK